MCDLVAVMNQGNLEQIGKPEALYQTPQSRFVAEFVTQANFLPARWDKDSWQTEIGWFEGGNLSNLERASAPPKGGRAELMICQEAIQLIVDRTSQIKIRDRQFLGREWIKNHKPLLSNTVKICRRSERPGPTRRELRPQPDESGYELIVTVPRMAEFDPLPPPLSHDRSQRYHDSCSELTC